MAMNENDPHPWTPQRWLVDHLYREMLEDYPTASKTYLFMKSKQVCLDAWDRLSKEERAKYISMAKDDASENVNTTPKKKKPMKEKEKKNVGKKKKANKDPNKPKAPLTAYFVYYNSKREVIMQANPDFGMIEVTKEASQRWREMSETEKQPYAQEAQRLKEQYQIEMKEYEKSLANSAEANPAANSESVGSESDE